MKTRIIKITTKERPKLSVFRAGFDELLNALLNGLNKRFTLIFTFLSCE
jgi:hypothetical protein